MARIFFWSYCAACVLFVLGYGIYQYAYVRGYSDGTDFTLNEFRKRSAKQPVEIIVPEKNFPMWS
jgi:hypothetical protein